VRRETPAACADIELGAGELGRCEARGYEASTALQRLPLRLITLRPLLRAARNHQCAGPETATQFDSPEVQFRTLKRHEALFVWIRDSELMCSVQSWCGRSAAGTLSRPLVPLSAAGRIRDE